MRQQSKEAGRQLSNTIEFWYRSRYHLPPNDPRFLSATPEMILTDYWAEYYRQHPSGEEFGADEDDFEDELRSFMASPSKVA